MAERSPVRREVKKPPPKAHLMLLLQAGGRGVSLRSSPVLKPGVHPEAVSLKGEVFRSSAETFEYL